MSTLTLECNLSLSLTSLSLSLSLSPFLVAPPAITNKLLNSLLPWLYDCLAHILQFVCLSVRLTALVLKTLCLAERITFVDHAILIDDGFAWLLDQVRDNGTLHERDRRLAQVRQCVGIHKRFSSHGGGGNRCRHVSVCVVFFGGK